MSTRRPVHERDGQSRRDEHRGTPRPPEDSGTERYVSAQLAASTAAGAALDGPPTLALEILSPSVKQEAILERVGEYLDAGVPLVWIVEPVYRTVSFYRCDQEPELSMGPRRSPRSPMAGLRAAVADIFGT